MRGNELRNILSEKLREGYRIKNLRTGKLEGMLIDNEEFSGDIHMEKNLKRKISPPEIILYICIAATLSFIWIHSAMPRVQSAGESGFFLELLRPILSSFLPDEWVTDHLVRKIAHFTEYGALGVELVLLIRVIKVNKGWKWLLNTAYIGLTIALIDETIQIFSARGPMIEDVWLDLAGYALCGGIVWGIRKAVERKTMH